MKLYYVSKEYMDFIKKYDNKIMQTTADNINYKNEKFVCGSVGNFNGKEYYAPVSSNVKEYYSSHVLHSDDGAIGSVRFSFMMPIPKTEIEEVNVNKLDSPYKEKVLSEESIINSEEKELLIRASEVYKKCNNIRFSKSFCDFKTLEKAYDTWNIEQDIIEAEKTVDLASKKVDSMIDDMFNDYTKYKDVIGKFSNLPIGVNLDNKLYMVSQIMEYEKSSYLNNDNYNKLDHVKLKQITSDSKYYTMDNKGNKFYNDTKQGNEIKYQKIVDTEHNVKASHLLKEPSYKVNMTEERLEEIVNSIIDNKIDNVDPLKREMLATFIKNDLKVKDSKTSFKEKNSINKLSNLEKRNVLKQSFQEYNKHLKADVELTNNSITNDKVPKISIGIEM